MKRLVLIALSAITCTTVISSFTPAAHALNQRFKDAHQQEINK